MTEKTKFKREEVLSNLSISDSELSLYEQELELSQDLPEGSARTFTEDDCKLIKIFHTLRNSGLSLSEIRILSSMSEMLKNTELDCSEDIKSLLLLSPAYRLKQSLNIAKQELQILRSKVSELEKSLNEVSESTSLSEEATFLKKELDIKTKTINNLDKRLTEITAEKARVESLLAAYKEGNPQLKIKSKKARELYEELVQKELELSEFKKRNEELEQKVNENLLEADELRDVIEAMEEDFRDRGEEIEEQYKEQIASLKSQIEQLVDRKQKEWESYYVKSSEQHKKELLTLQKRHEHYVSSLKHKIKMLQEELNEVRSQKNPFSMFLKRP